MDTLIFDERSTQGGLWKARGVPKKGWTCVGCYDVVEETGDYMTCEMCQIKTIRYVHVMTHPKYGEELKCGCICAGRMDGTDAAKRESDVKNRAGRRFRFPDLAAWKVSAKGNDYIKKDGYLAILIPTVSGYKIMITKPDGKNFWGTKLHTDMRKARTAVFDALEYLDKRLTANESYDS